ncbi:syntaxin-5-like [Watersipora subatra]|uniref:syntaxin-5-like n=1 Tax=Watersipora subatra TaxID=2589382 RepID=UPI00355C806D
MSSGARNRFTGSSGLSAPVIIESNSRSSSPTPLTALPNKMSGRDRTSEFMSVVHSLHSPQSNGAITTRSAALHQNSKFMKIARHIGKDLGNTFTKLDALTALCRKKSLFDDKQAEIQELTYIIKQDINSLNGQIAQLQDLARDQRGTSGKHQQSHSNSVVLSLQSQLASMSNNFKTVLEERTQNMKHEKSRREQFTDTQLHASPPSERGAVSVLWQDEMNARGSSDVSIDIGGAGAHFQQDQLQLIEDQDTYIQSRADTMKNIESTIVELGGIFSKLAHMVKEQEEMVQRIDANVEDAHLNVEAAHSQILQYFQSVTSNRWLMVKIFGVLILFFIIFVVFLA